ncbi:MAG TPA: class I SAM-dependent methyltransferase [Nitrososphaerales archaeon]|nr:class I SAM-dependent methyltransferase [Nitrososphaerales archaeon]
MFDGEVRGFEIASRDDKLLESNREIWKTLGIKQSDAALFFPCPNALVPLMFARFMNKRKVTFVDSSEINVNTLIKLAAQIKLSNVTVKLATVAGKFPVADNAFDIVFSDWGLSSFLPSAPKAGDSEALAKELVRVLKPDGKVAALEENGAPVMYPCPPEIIAIRSKMDAHRADRLVMGRRIYSLFKSCKLRNIAMKGYSYFLTSDDHEFMKDELTRRISALESSPENFASLGITVQEQDKYKNWLKAQMGSDSFLIQFNSILTTAEK